MRSSVRFAQFRTNAGRDHAECLGCDARPREALRKTAYPADGAIKTRLRRAAGADHRVGRPFVGFWIDEGHDAPEITGSRPIQSPIGSANVTWIIRWESKAARDLAMKTAFAGPDWQEVWARHPDPNGYVQMSARFMSAT